MLAVIAKVTDKDKKLRLEDLFRKLSQTEHIKTIILMYRAADPCIFFHNAEQQKAFLNFVKSANS